MVILHIIQAHGPTFDFGWQISKTIQSRMIAGFANQPLFVAINNKRRRNLVNVMDRMHPGEDDKILGAEEFSL
jgi:hypothetical protein